MKDRLKPHSTVDEVERRFACSFDPDYGVIYMGWTADSRTGNAKQVGLGVLPS